MDLEGITLSEMRHGKTKTIWFLLHMESKKRKINQPNKNRHNELMVAERAGVWGSGKKGGRSEKHKLALAATVTEM